MFTLSQSVQKDLDPKMKEQMMEKKLSLMRPGADLDGDEEE